MCLASSYPKKRPRQPDNAVHIPDCHSIPPGNLRDGSIDGGFQHNGIAGIRQERLIAFWAAEARN